MTRVSGVAVSDIALEDLFLLTDSGSIAHRLELLDSSAANRLPDEEIALGVHGYRVQERELASHVTEATETRERLPASTRLQNIY